MVDTVRKTGDNSIEREEPTFVPTIRVGFFVPEEMNLELTQDAEMQLEYDLLLERARSHEERDYPPHTDNATQMVGMDGHGVPGCYMTQAAEASQ